MGRERTLLLQIYPNKCEIDVGFTPPPSYVQQGVIQVSFADEFRREKKVVLPFISITIFNL